ncbi:MAG: IS200/IS605 family element transposase accessory protein TnpB [Moorea sp. SIO3I6]|uniref:RNA-guided endonuclease InsQ/TnpB family protein n=2 Tax=Moorena TaxID=1155738 RepID=UPI0013C64657|nr:MULTISPECIES: transposase [unclassified Moorena]NEO21518.1 IS200/IS605 family element transposase accessory protein TnpB [Moorena sp. SIO4A5]NEP25405.1 IS200/IS605 family element transposase accessory protein TnpB [Moorena sp. SIO3I6]NEQ59104.1 IS200/IS605 family element transposase accessory protein TnpB [Moorena sp. SIO4A1]
MILTYCYRFKPSPEQIATMEWWLELLRRHWNYALGQRLNWLHRTRSPIDRCSLVSEPIGEIPEPVSYYTQQAALKETKRLFPEYKKIYAETQQVNLQRLNKAWDRWRKPDASGKRGGRPRFKKTGELRSFVFPRVNSSKAGAHLIDGVLKLSRIGSMPVIMHRPLPRGFTLKQCTIVRKADGWYCCLSMKDDTVPEILPIDSVKTAVGIDVGLEKFLTTSDGEAVSIPKFYRKAQDKLAQAQKVMSRRVKGSKNWKKAKHKVALLHLHLTRCRKEFHYQVAHWLCNKYDLIAHEDLNIKGLARSKLAKSIHDAAWGAFLEILQAVAVKRGLLVQEVNPRGTSIECFNCGSRVEKSLSERVHCCLCCQVKIDRDWNSGINILNRGLMAVGLPLNGCGKSIQDIEEQQVSYVSLRSPHHNL